MKWRLWIVLAMLILGNVLDMPARPEPAAPGGIRGALLEDVAAPLLQAWLRFHEKEYCLDVDSIFVFQPKGIEIWCLANDAGDYQKLASLMEPLRKSYRIDIYTTYSDRLKKPYAPEDDDPPPSLWTNAELRAYYRDPFAGRAGMFDDPVAYESVIANPVLKRNLKLFSDQILEWKDKMERLAADLPPLAEAGYGPMQLADLRSLSRSVCRAHARELAKYASRLEENLSHALPRGSGAGRPRPAPEPSRKSADPRELARELSSEALHLGRRITAFFYPQAHTVPLGDLRESSLIDALKKLESSVADFERIAPK